MIFELLESIIKARYNANDEKNESLANNGHPKSFVAGKEIPDSGQYLLTADDLAQFPAGAYVTIHLIRGNFELVTGAYSGESFSIGAISEVSFSGKVTN